MRLGARQGASLLIYRRSGYRGRLYTTCRHDEIDKSHKSTQTLGKPPLTFARAIARKHAHGMHKAARRLTELASAHPGHAKTPARTYRAVRSAPPPDAAPGCRGAPSEEKGERYNLLYFLGQFVILFVSARISCVSATYQLCISVSAFPRS